MINIHIVRDSEGYIREFTVRGHAGYGEHGSDIVCSAVSAVAYTAAGALDELAGIGHYREKDGYMKVSLPADIPQDRKSVAGIIMETACIGFKQIENAYGDYVEVLDEEV